MSNAKSNHLANIVKMLSSYGKMFDALIKDLELNEEQAVALMNAADKDKSVEELTSMIEGFLEPQPCGKCPACMMRKMLEGEADDMPEDLKGFLQAILPGAIIVKVSKSKFVPKDEKEITKH